MSLSALRPVYSPQTPPYDVTRNDGYTDAVLKCKTRQFFVHERILREQSGYFPLIFDRQRREDEIGEPIDMGDCDPVIADLFIHFLYNDDYPEDSQESALPPGQSTMKTSTHPENSPCPSLHCEHEEDEDETDEEEGSGEASPDAESPPPDIVSQRPRKRRRISTCTIETADNNDDCPFALLAALRLYVMASHFEVESLVRLAHDRFVMAATRYGWWCDGFFEVVHELIDTTWRKDPLRLFVYRFISKDYPKSRSLRRKVAGLAWRHPELALGVLDVSVGKRMCG